MHSVEQIPRLRNVTFLLPRNASSFRFYRDLFPSPSPGHLFSVPIALLFPGGRINGISPCAAYWVAFSLSPVPLRSARVDVCTTESLLCLVQRHSFCFKMGSCYSYNLAVYIFCLVKYYKPTLYNLLYLSLRYNSFFLTTPQYSIMYLLHKAFNCSSLNGHSGHVQFFLIPGKYKSMIQ